MGKSGRRFLHQAESDYLRSQINTGDNAKIKSALQDLCKFYRDGLAVRADQRRGIVNEIVGTAFNEKIDEKVRRWVLNTLARIGSEGDSIEAVLHLIRRHRNEPQTVASGVAAIFKLCVRKSPEETLEGLRFDPTMVTLAALQHVPASEIELKGLPINVDKASADLLRLALIVVGLGRSPENLLNPRHSDAEMVRALGGHHDNIVSQYSVWAITENNGLGVTNLGIDPKNIDDYPPNVRAWVLQLLSKEASASKSYWDIIQHGMSDPSPEARRGLALGFQETFLDIYEPLILDWLISEDDNEVRQHLIDHIVRQAHRSRIYENMAIELYELEANNVHLRQRMEASAARHPIYTRFKQIQTGALGDLFERGSVTMVEKQYNIGNIQGGAVSVGDGVAVNYGSVNPQLFEGEHLNAIHEELAKMEAALHESTLDLAEKERALEHVKVAKAEPTVSNLGKVIDFVSHLGKIADAGRALAPYVSALTKIINL